MRCSGTCFMTMRCSGSCSMHGPDGPLGLIPSLPRQVLPRSEVAAGFPLSSLPSPCAARYA
eukprot:4927955-Heterocapsa_arctica.AAC.1